MHLDVPTLGVTGFLIGIVLALGFTMLGRILPGERPLCSWIAAFWLATLGALLGGLRGRVPEPVTVLLGNGCLALGSALVVVGVALHLRRPSRWRALLAICAAYVAALAWFEFADPDIVVRMVLANVQSLVFDVWVVALLLGRVPATIRRSTRFAALMFALEAVANIVRLVMLASGAGLGAEPAGGPAMAFAFVSGILLALAQALAFILLVAERLVVDLRHQARFDGLTGLLNRAACEEEGARALELCARNRLPCALLMIDLDHFKRVNDRFGHQAGDAVLRHFAALVRRKGRRSGDLLARYGGEEFMLLLPGTDVDTARELAERLRQRLREQPASFRGRSIEVSASVGIAGRDAGSSFESMVAAADAALYAAKHAGRDRVCVAPAQAARAAAPSR